MNLVESRLKPITRMGKKKDRMEENSRIFFENVIDGYRKLALECPNRYFIIDANLSKEAIHNKIILVIS